MTDTAPTEEIVIDHDVGPSVGSSIAWATWALFAGMALLLVGSGLYSTVIGVRAAEIGFSSFAIGAIGAGYYAGFLAGSRLTLVVLAQVGHIRVFVAFASLLTGSMIATGMYPSVGSWIGLRFISGLCIAGLYVVAESWLNHLATNESRGKLLAVYMVISGGCFGAGQFLVGWVETRDLASFATAALFTSLAVVPVALSEDANPPVIAPTEKYGLRDLARDTPSGAGSCLLVGLAHGATAAMIAAYATSVGMSAPEVGRFVAATAVGAVLLQWPISAASDEIDRRFVGVVTAAGAVIVVIWLLIDGPFGGRGLVAMGLFGGLSFPLYSLAGAYTNDWVPSRYANAAASQVVALFGIGALIGPLFVAVFQSVAGAEGFLWALLVAHLAIIAFLIYRLLSWQAPIARRPWSEASYSARAFFVPAEVVWAGRRFRSRHRRPRPRGMPHTAEVPTISPTTPADGPPANGDAATAPVNAMAGTEGTR